MTDPLSNATGAGSPGDKDQFGPWRHGPRAVLSRLGVWFGLGALTLLVVLLGALILQARFEAHPLPPASAAVTSLAFSGDGRRLAVGAADGTLEIHALAGGEGARTIQGRGGPVIQAEFFGAAAGDQIVYAHALGPVLVERTDGRSPPTAPFPISRRPARLHVYPTGVDVAGEGAQPWIARLPVGSDVASVMSLVRTGDKVPRQWLPDPVLGWRRDGAPNEFVSDRGRIFEDLGDAPRLRGASKSLAAPEIIARSLPYVGPVSALAYCNERQLLMLKSAAEDPHPLRIVDLVTGQARDYPFKARLDNAEIIACAADPARLIVKTASGDLRLVDEQGWRKIARRDRITALAFDREGRLLTACCGERLPAGLAPTNLTATGIRAGQATVSRDGWLAITLSRFGDRYTASVGGKLAAILPRNSSVARIAASPGGDAAALSDGSLKIYPLGRCLADLMATRDLADGLWTINRRGLICRFGAKALRLPNITSTSAITAATFGWVEGGEPTRVLVGYENGDVVALSLETGQAVARFGAQGGAVTRMTLSPDGGVVAVGGADGGVRLIRVSGKMPVASTTQAIADLRDALDQFARAQAPIPIERVHAPWPTAGQPMLLRGKTLLWVHANKKGDSALPDEFERLGVKVLRAGNVTEAQKPLSEQALDIVLIDLPTSDDDLIVLDAVRRVHRSRVIAAAPAPPVILYSSVRGEPSLSRPPLRDSEAAYQDTVALLSGGLLAPPHTVVSSGLPPVNLLTARPAINRGEIASDQNFVSLLMAEAQRVMRRSEGPNGQSTVTDREAARTPTKAPP